MAFKEQILQNGQAFPADIFIRDSRQERLVAPLHWHDCLELLYVLEGSASQRINDQVLTLRVGDLVLLRDGDLHATATEPGEPSRILVVKFLSALLTDTYARNVESVHVRAFLSQENPRVLHISEGDPDAQALHRLLDTLLEEWTAKRPAYELAVHGLLYCAIAALTRMGAFSSRMSFLPALEQARLTSVLDRAAAMLPSVMTLGEAAQMMNYSYSYFSRHFQKATGYSFKAYMDFMRIREAERLALQEGLPLASCAVRTGFSDAATFARTYRRLRGCSARSMLGSREHARTEQRTSASVADSGITGDPARTGDG